MIPMRHYPDRTLRIEMEDLDAEWSPLGYSEYCIRAVSDGYGQIGTIEIKHSDDIEWGDEE